jgi:hypothetical protein
MLGESSHESNYGFLGNCYGGCIPKRAALHVHHHAPVCTTSTDIECTSNKKHVHVIIVVVTTSEGQPWLAVHEHVLAAGSKKSTVVHC